MDIHEFICKHDVDFSPHPMKPGDVEQAAIELNVRFGPQLTEYLTEYGYLGFESVEFYGLNTQQGMDSDLAKQTRYLHQYFAATVPYTALENLGEGAYLLADGEDLVFRYLTEEDRLEPLGENLFGYILRRFEEEL